MAFWQEQALIVGKRFLGEEKEKKEKGLQFNLL